MRPVFRVDYRWHKRFRFEADMGGEFSTRHLGVNTENTSAYFFSLGNRLDFWRFRDRPRFSK
jgi:hypothetical protein